MLTTLLLAGISALLCLAAARDVATRLVPDSISIAIAVLAIGLRAGQDLQAVLVSVFCAALVFTILLALCMRGWIGGADVKLAAALVLALPPGAVPDFILATTLVGGVMGLAYAARPRLAFEAGPGLMRRVLVAESRRLRRGGPLPYCVAIAAGGILTLIANTGT